MARRGVSKTYELSPDQAAALDLLLAGQSVTATAGAVGVARETVSRWRNSDPAFMAAYNAAVKAAYDAGQARLLDARARAVDTLAGLLDSDDPATVLKAAGLLLRVSILEPVGPTDPADIAADQARAQLFRF